MRRKETMKRRLDQYLSDEGICASREKAKRAILAGAVRLNGQRARKPSDIVRKTDNVQLIPSERYISRGGFKLEHALRCFQIEVGSLTAVDLGASTGGFTDCLLQHGAAQVYAVDVGKGQLAWKLRQDSRVEIMEGVNARHLRRSQMPAPFPGADLAAIDCSFISLTKILPAIVPLLVPAGKIIALVKPQFEAGKPAADRGRGVIRDPRIHKQVLQKIRQFAVEELNLRWIGVCESPIFGVAGNREFLCLIEKSHAQNSPHRAHCESGKDPLEGELATSGGAGSQRR